MTKAIKRTYTDCTLIMYWFHQKYNLRKYKAILRPKVYRIICKQVNSLHTCKWSASFTLLKNFLKSWENYPN